jgi:diphthine-ammonia ligase
MEEAAMEHEIRVTQPLSPSGQRTICSFSGGKDSCLALWRAQRSGFDVQMLLAMFDEDGDRSRSHAIPRSLMERQARALGLPLTTRNASWQRYEEVFIEALIELRASGHDTVVFGDIDLQAHREWEERVCASAGLRAHLPLWQGARRALAEEVIDSGFRAIIVCTDSRYLDDRFCGRLYDRQFLAELPEGVDVCGENGEFHTFVCGGPNFREQVAFTIDGFEDHVAPAQYGGVRYRFAKLS